MARVSSKLATTAAARRNRKQGGGSGNQSTASDAVPEVAFPACRPLRTQWCCKICPPVAHVLPASCSPVPAVKMAHPSPAAKPSNPKNPRVFFDVDIGGERGERLPRSGPPGCASARPPESGPGVWRELAACILPGARPGIHEFSLSLPPCWRCLGSLGSFSNFLLQGSWRPLRLALDLVALPCNLFTAVYYKMK